MVGYAGPFAGEYRQNFEKLWLKTEELPEFGSPATISLLMAATGVQDEEGITHKQGATLVSVLGQPAWAQVFWLGLTAVRHGLLRKWSFVLPTKSSRIKWTPWHSPSVTRHFLIPESGFLLFCGRHCRSCIKVPCFEQSFWSREQEGRARTS